MRRYIFLLISIFILVLLALPVIISGRFTFVFDMGRDLLWTRNMVELKKPTLIGPWGSIAGIYFGPGWYYLLSIPYILTSGDPRGSAIVPLMGNIVSICLGWWWLGRKKHYIAANIWAVLYASSSIIVSLSSFPFHANLLPLVTLVFFVGLSESKFFPLSALSASLTYHLEPAAGIMLTIFLFLFAIVSLLQSFERLKLLKFLQPLGLKQISISIIIFVIPFLPQTLFELRHDFIQTKSLAAYFKGENTSLGGILPLGQRVIERVDKIAGTLSYTVFPLSGIWQQRLILAIYLLLIIIMIKKYRFDKFVHSFSLLVSCLLLFHYLAYVIIFPAELKGWYISGFSAIFILSSALVIEKIYRDNVALAVLTILGISLISSRPLTRVKDWLQKPPAAAETLAAQLEAVDWIYADAITRAEPFSVYTYTPPIYDYTFQYLLWWRGSKQNQILPAEYAYKPRETTYLPDKEKFISKEWRPEDAEFIYLVIEQGGSVNQLTGWLGGFVNLSNINTREFPSGITVETRLANKAL